MAAKLITDLDDQRAVRILEASPLAARVVQLLRKPVKRNTPQPIHDFAELLVPYRVKARLARCYRRHRQVGGAAAGPSTG